MLLDAVSRNINHVVMQTSLSYTYTRGGALLAMHGVPDHDRMAPLGSSSGTFMNLKRKMCMSLKGQPAPSSFGSVRQ